jgi:hypothetical protein
MRPSRTVAGSALTALLALGALPGLVGSHEPGVAPTIDAAAFRQVSLATSRDRQADGQLGPDTAGRSEGALDEGTAFAEAGTIFGEPADVESRSAGERAQPNLQAASSAWTWKKPRFSISGAASFYDHGTTAMRDVPRGTTIVICGRGGCIQTVVSDYGPARSTGRVIDMYRPDFFKVCGCGWWSGTAEVTVRVY